MEPAMNSLSRELDFFAKHKAEWLARQEGKYVLIKGDELGGFFDNAEAAFENGVDRWGNVPMLIKRVLPTDPVESSPALRFGLINVHT